ncbi:MAG: hypothetical protein V1717_00370 [Candidatus Micrarchaeota archaeon]
MLEVGALDKTKVGEVEHYYGHLGVAVINVVGTLKVGDKILFENKLGQPVLEQIVTSMQIAQNKIEEAKPGQAIGLKVGDKVHQGNVVYKV